MNPTCTHVALFCNDIEASVRFYSDYTAMHEVHRRSDDGTVVVWMAEPGRDEEFVIVLLGIRRPSNGDGAVAHLGYALASREEVDAIAARARGAGVEVQGPVHAGPVVGYFCMLRDPDRNWIEFSYGQSLGRKH